MARALPVISPRRRARRITSPLKSHSKRGAILMSEPWRPAIYSSPRLWRKQRRFDSIITCVRCKSVNLLRWPSWPRIQQRQLPYQARFWGRQQRHCSVCPSALWSLSWSSHRWSGRSRRRAISLRLASRSSGFLGRAGPCSAGRGTIAFSGGGHGGSASAGSRLSAGVGGTVGGTVDILCLLDAKPRRIREDRFVRVEHDLDAVQLLVAERFLDMPLVF